MLMKKMERGSDMISSGEYVPWMRLLSTTVMLKDREIASSRRFVR